MSTIENRHLRYFLEVAKTLHITRAAERLHIAQPALTQNIQQLEQELGVKLFDRKGRRLSLTEAGLVFAEEADYSLRTFYGAQLAAKRAERGEVGKIVIGFQSPAGLKVIPQLLKNLREKYPDVRVLLHEMGSSAQRAALRRSEIDIAVTYTLLDREFAHHELVPELLVIALPERHPLASCESVSFKDVEDEVFILPGPEVAEILYRAVLAECAEFGFQPRQIQDVSTAQTALGLVFAGFGIAVLPSSVHQIVRAGVVLRPIRNSKLQAQLTLMWSPKRCSPIIPKILECLG